MVSQCLTRCGVSSVLSMTARKAASGASSETDAGTRATESSTCGDGTAHTTLAPTG